MNTRRIFAAFCLAGLLVLSTAGHPAPAAADDGFHYFPETDRAVRGPFYEYWQAHGGLDQQGLALSDEFTEVSALDHRPYTVQYFERAVFEYHPEYQGSLSAVLASLLGVYEYQQRYGAGGAPGQHASSTNPRLFPETGKTLGGLFRTYWETHGGLAQQGYPISDEFTEVSTLDGQPHTVQYFQRAVFEYHPEYAGTPHAVLLAQLGTYRYRELYRRRPLVEPQPGYEQMAPLGSDTFLVWAERGRGPTTLRALELATGRVQLVADSIRDWQAVALDGARVVWLDSPSCPQGACGSLALRGKDLATGQSFTVADGPGVRSTPAIAGTTVVWNESPITDSPASGPRGLLAQDLTTGAVTVLPTGGPAYSPLVSAEYIVWIRVDGTASLIQAYDRRTGQVQAAATEQLAPGQLPRVALAGHYLVWLGASPQVNLANLQTGLRTVLAQDTGVDLTIQGETVLWSGPGGGDEDIWGLTLRDARPRLLVQAEGHQWHPTVAGDRLVWANERGANGGRLCATALAAALAGSGP